MEILESVDRGIGVMKLALGEINLPEDLNVKFRQNKLQEVDPSASDDAL